MSEKGKLGLTKGVCVCVAKGKQGPTRGVVEKGKLGPTKVSVVNKKKVSHKTAAQQAINYSQNQNTSQHQGFPVTTLPDQNTSGESPPSRQINLAGSSVTKSISHNFHPAKGPRHQKAFTEINDSFEDDY